MTTNIRRDRYYTIVREKMTVKRKRKKHTTKTNTEQQRNSVATAAGPPTADSATTDLTTADDETSGDDTGSTVDDGVPDDAVILQGPDLDAFCFCASFENITDDNGTYYVDNVDTAAICLASDSIVAYYDIGDGKIVANVSSYIHIHTYLRFS